MMGSVSGTLATMGCAVPYAIAAKFAYPERPVIALVGDGAMQMNGLAELITIAKYWRRWADPRLVVMVLNNRDLAYVTWEERIQLGDPKWESSQVLPDVPYAEFAQSIGLEGMRVEDPEQVGPGLGQGSCRRPAIRARHGDRSERAAASAPHYPEAGPSLHGRAGKGRSRGWQRARRHGS
jgi:thiamine pyrophosphate-dependent acetolactate synthase large subunit-like protein